jgi:PST family polysaccharide transporter
MTEPLSETPQGEPPMSEPTVTEGPVAELPVEVATIPDEAGVGHGVEVVPTMPRGRLGQRAVQGVLVTAGATVAFELLRFAGGVVTARYIRPADYALGYAAIFALSLGFRVLDFQLPQRLVQRADDPGDSFDYGFTLALGLGILYALFAVIAAPVISRLYGSRALLLAGLVLGLQAVQLPAAIAGVYLARELRWGRQVVVGGAGPLAGVLVGLLLALHGDGLWALVYGQLAASLLGAAVLWALAPRRPRVRLPIPRSELRQFLGFGWPLWLGSVVQVICVNGILLEVSSVLGLAALAYFRLATSLGQRIDTAEGVVSSVLFPVLSRAPTPDRMRRAFVLSGKLILLWAVPAGFGLTVFAGDIVRFVLGPNWYGVVPLLWVEGIGEVFNAIATTWAVFYMATGNNRPAFRLGLQVNVLMLVLMGVFGLLWGFAGIVLTIAIAVLYSLAQRRRMVLRLMPGVPVLRSGARLIGAGLVASAVTLLAKSNGHEAPTESAALLRVVLFLATYTVGALVLETPFLKEGWEIMRQRGLPD